jgi:hypothetical protein
MIGPLNLHSQTKHDLRRRVKHREGGFSVWAEGVRQSLVSRMTRLFCGVKHVVWRLSVMHGFKNSCIMSIRCSRLPSMRFFDSALSIMLAAVIHQDDRQVRLTAKRCLAKTLSKNDRVLISSIINSPAPLAHVYRMIGSMPDYLFHMPASDKPSLPTRDMASVTDRPEALLSHLSLSIRR